eukprot:CAMPEP_0118935510 /NCGR_PEP_ID=MMETSP1169-20130426/15683_1 /TAXON_ID=36882 /ORGANISM="Pyramimonas obovata, Strain CCMP722" /LENGTH=90 /DNA_ID=CAMNT_0006878555 /DNA_START=188 /DNA_END=460 /DNA_ORIENTATION=-
MSSSGESQAPNNPGKTERPIAAPTPHRCNDRLEDVIEALFAPGYWSENLVPTWRVFMNCMNSEVGQEPTDPFRFYTPKAMKVKSTSDKFG